MTVTPSSRGSFMVDGIFTTSEARVLQGANVYWDDTGTGIAQEMDSITLQVVDSASVEQYTLTTLSTPAIVLESPANVYAVDEIDVSGFPDGNISLTWTATLDGYEYTSEQTVVYNTEPSMLFITGLTDTLEDSKVVLGVSKTFTVRVSDSLQNAVDGYDVRLAITDRNTSGVTRTSADLQAAGTGLWKVTTTLTTDDYSADLDRYELHWEIQLEASGTWFEIQNSRRPLKFYGLSTNVTTGPLSYSTNEDLRICFPGIDALLSDLLPNQAEREILLNNARLEASNYIYNMVKNSRTRAKKELLKSFECYHVYRNVLLKAHAFSKYAVSDGQLEHLDKHIKRLTSNIFSPMQTIRVGGRR